MGHDAPVGSLQSILKLLEAIDDDDASAIEEAKLESTGSFADVPSTIEIEAPHDLIMNGDYGASLDGRFEDQYMEFEDIEAKTEEDMEELSEEISKIIQALNEDW